MNGILEYILTNYTWLLGGAIIILLAIIGSYADKTNFGQGKQDDKEEIREKDLLEEIPQNLGIAELMSQNSEALEENSQEEQKSLEKVEEIETENENGFDDSFEEQNENEKTNSFDDSFEKLNEEIEEFLPDEEVVDGELLDEIENLSLDKTQSINLSDIPDLDDVELPKIKNLKSDDGDIWKF